MFVSLYNNQLKEVLLIKIILLSFSLGTCSFFISFWWHHCCIYVIYVSYVSVILVCVRWILIIFVSEFISLSDAEAVGVAADTDWSVDKAQQRPSLAIICHTSSSSAAHWRQSRVTGAAARPWSGDLTRLRPTEEIQQRRSEWRNSTTGTTLPSSFCVVRFYVLLSRVGLFVFCSYVCLCALVFM